MRRLIWLISFSTLGNVVAFLSAPLIAILYGAKIMGELASIISIGSLFVVLCTFRVELGVASGDELLRKAVPAFIVFSLIVTSVASQFIPINSLVFTIFVILQSSYLLLSSVLVADDKFKLLGFLRFLRSFIVVILQLLFFYFFADLGYTLGLVLGLLLVVIALCVNVKSDCLNFYENIRRFSVGYFPVIRSYLSFNMPYSFLIIFISAFPVIYYSTIEKNLLLVGNVALAERIIGTPFNMLNQSIRDVMMKSVGSFRIRVWFVLSLFALALFVVGVSDFVELLFNFVPNSFMHEWGLFVDFAPYVFCFYASMLSGVTAVVLLVKVNKQQFLLLYSVFLAIVLFVFVMVQNHTNVLDVSFVRAYYASIALLNFIFAFSINYLFRDYGVVLEGADVGAEQAP
ncbi:hypothetical protein [Teredinibacter turnerae]|uniref:hypothetical protein n=1 Tax=Teredinibacter turnerae TaxID=2426 RepID=UPI00035CDADB|nr:hypothetical protein [Teredinibacter turnerae]